VTFDFGVAQHAADDCDAGFWGLASGEDGGDACG
jgi:hypothetical protein